MAAVDVTGHLPNFLLVGAAKSGTTALASFLGQNPEIFISRPKEPRFLVADEWLAIDPASPGYAPTMRDLVTELDTYRGLFSSAGDRTRRGEASVTYLLYHQTAIPRIQALLGDVPIVIVLRHPVDLAVSAYRHMRSRGWERESIEVALESEPERRAAGWGPGYFYSGLAAYGDGVEAYVDAFSQVSVLLHEDLENQPEATVASLCDFLGLEAHPLEFQARHNQSKIKADPRPQQRLLRRMTDGVPRNWIPSRARAVGRRFADPGDVDIDVSPSTRARLLVQHSRDIDVVERITCRDLGRWRT